MAIWFYSKTPGYAFLSNFSEHAIELNGHWPSVEHLYQAAKFSDAAIQELIRGAVSASTARSIGQDRSLTPRPDWLAIRVEVMHRAVRAKFEQHRDLACSLLLTGDEELIHVSSDDLFWGRTRQGDGRNRLGEILMNLRANLRGGPAVDACANRHLPKWVLFHAPHDATFIPANLTHQFTLGPEGLWAEVVAMTDHFALDLLGRGVDADQILRAPVSRLVVDVERWDDDASEPMAAAGMGVVYERTSDGQQLRCHLGTAERQALIDEWYRPHHEQLNARVLDAVDHHGQALLIDVHSFPSKPRPYDQDKSIDRPDVCIGSDADHTPPALAAAFASAFTQAGFTTKRDTPFSGAMVPRCCHRTDTRVAAVMVEINRGLYLDELIGMPLPGYEVLAVRVRRCIDAATLAWAHRKY